MGIGLGLGLGLGLGIGIGLGLERLRLNLDMSSRRSKLRKGRFSGFTSAATYLRRMGCGTWGCRLDAPGCRVALAVEARLQGRVAGSGSAAAVARAAA